MPRQSNALEMLRQEHRQMQSLFQQLETSSGKEQEKLCREMIDALQTARQTSGDGRPSCRSALLDVEFGSQQAR